MLRWVRAALLLLFVGHAALLVGGYLVLVGARVFGPLSVPAGWALVAIGGGCELAVAARSARGIVGGSATGPRDTPPTDPLLVPSAGVRRLCAGCGWTGRRSTIVCPRCGRVTVAH